MSRCHVDFPVWVWKCDRCGAISGELARHQSHLATPDEMRARGWFIADKWGDLCYRCKEGVTND